ncbi:MAG TPA: hypothetical protein VLB29_19285 [Nocardioidaceae bacterium]|nr:hypothetical protein [Nocardioidaceae bacterium]
MADPLAYTSVVSSWLIAMGALYASYRSGGDQRRHEERLAQGERGWEKKSQGLYAAIAAARTLVDAIDNRGSLEVIEALDGERGDYEAAAHEHLGVSEVGVRVGDVVDRLQRLVPAVEVYGTAECREAFHDLRHLLRDSGYDPRASERLEAVRRGKHAALDTNDYRSATTARRLERKVLEDARVRLTIDLADARTKAERLIEAARENLAADAASA